MDRPTNPMTITAVFTFADPLAYEALATLVTRQLLTCARFRQRVVDGGAGRAYWEDVPVLHLADHLVRAELPAGAGREALEGLVSRLMSERLATDRPPWQFHLVERYRGGSALVARVHHCVGDGIALVQLLLSMADPIDVVAAAPALPGEERQVRAPENEGLRSLVSPSRLIAAARVGGGVTAVLGRLLDLRADPRTVLRGTLGRAKLAVWSEPIPLDAVRTVGRATAGTINDVLLASVAGALRRYLAARGDRVDGLVLRAVVPVNLRRAGDAMSLGNKFGLVFLRLPVGEAGALARLAATKRYMDAIKRSPEAVVVFGLLRALGKTTTATLVAAVRLLARRASAVVTNVPGPRTHIRFAGALVDGMMFWVPQSGRLGLGVSVLSYAGEVRVGVAADAHLVPDPTALVTAFHHALGELVATMPGAGADDTAAPGVPAPGVPAPGVPDAPPAVVPA